MEVPCRALWVVLLMLKLRYVHCMVVALLLAFIAWCGKLIGQFGSLESMITWLWARLWYIYRCLGVLVPTCCVTLRATWHSLLVQPCTACNVSFLVAVQLLTSACLMLCTFYLLGVQVHILLPFWRVYMALLVVKCVSMLITHITKARLVAR